MKKLNNTVGKRIAATFFCALFTLPAYSSSIGYGDDPYTSGDTLTADGLNAKFNEIKAAVNDNNTNIGNTAVTLAGTAVNIGDNANNIAAIRAKVDHGAVSIHGAQFNFEASPTGEIRSALGISQASGVNKKVFASVSLPHGVTVSAMTCAVSATGTSPFLASFYRMPISAVSSTAGFIFQTGITTVSTFTQQFISDTVADPAYAEIDNINHAYVIFMELESAAMLQGCSITY